jgi:hypothetical protein
MGTKMRVLIVAVIILFVPFTALAENKYIKQVKRNTIDGCELVNFGLMLSETNFDNAKWDYFIAASGVGVVEFTGKINQRLHDTAIKNIIANSGPATMWNVARNSMTSAEYSAAHNSDEYDSAKTDNERYRAVGKYYLDRYSWVVGTDVKMQFIVEGENIKLGVTKNKTWPDERSLVIYRVICESTTTR